jgi:hypothetical protein
MANLIIKSSADNLVLQGSDASPAITVGATGTTTFAENTTLSGTGNNLGTVTAGTLANTITYPSGSIIKTSYFETSDKKTLSGGQSSTTIVDLGIEGQFIQPNKLLSTTDLYISVVMAAHQSSNGSSVWWMKTGTNSTWLAVGGMHTGHATSAGQGHSFVLQVRLPAAYTGAGANTISIGWSTNTGYPFLTWNPDSSTHGEFTGGTISNAFVNEVMV